MDGDELRHNKLTIHKKWNNSVAILSGDAILALAFKKQWENNKEYYRDSCDRCLSNGQWIQCHIGLVGRFEVAALAMKHDAKYPRD